MNYSDLQQIDIHRCLNEIAEFALPRFTKNKVLSITINMDVSCYGGAEMRERRELTFVFYRPDNFMFVGLVEDDSVNDKSQIEYLSCHDSCWRDAITHKINLITQEMGKKFEDRKDASVFNHFGIGGGITLMDGYVKYDRDKRTAKFIMPEKAAV